VPPGSIVSIATACGAGRRRCAGALACMLLQAQHFIAEVERADAAFCEATKSDYSGRPTATRLP
jgi:hypothetical protein